MVGNVENLRHPHDICELAAASDTPLVQQNEWIPPKKSSSYGVRARHRTSSERAVDVDTTVLSSCMYHPFDGHVSPL